MSTSLEHASPVRDLPAPPPAPLAFETVRTLDGFEALAGEWDVLVRAMPRPSPFLLHGWLAEWWRCFGAGAEMTVVAARRDGRLVAAAPLYVRRSRGLRVARFLGGHESALADLLVGPDEGEATRRVLLDEVARQRFDFADLFGLPAGSAFAADDRITVFERVEAPVLLMPDGWEAAYTAKTGSKTRNQHRRRLRQLGEAGGVEFVEGRTREELEPLLEDCLALHELRWAGRPDGSTFGTDQGRVFHRAALRRLADAEVLRIVLMRVAGKPAAFHYFFALDGVMHVHRLAFDPELGRLSPGLVSTLETLRRASDEGITRVEFLGGGERYKMELADRHEPLHQAIGLAANPLAQVGARATVGAIRLRRTLKRSERLQRLYLNGPSSLLPGRGARPVQAHP